MNKCREAFEAWFRTTKAYQMLVEQNYFKMNLFHFIDGRNEYRHSSVQVAFMTWQSRQAEVDRLNEVLDKRTKEWLEAIELGKYFENVAKPLKAELDEKDKRIDTLITQIEMSDFKDSLGHELKSNLAYLDLKALRGES